MSKLQQILKHIKRYRFRSVFVRQFLTILLIVVLPLGIMDMLILFFYESGTAKEMHYANQMTFGKMAENVENFKDNIDKIAYAILSNEDVQLFIGSADIGKDNKVLYARTNLIKNTANSFVLANNMLDTIYIYSEENRHIIGNQMAASLSGFNDISWLDSYRRAEDTKAEWVEVRQKTPSNPSNDRGKYLTFYYAAKPYGERAGVVVINVNLDKVAQMLDVAGGSEEYNFRILDAGGKILFSTDEALIGSAESEDSCTKSLNEVVFQQKSEYTNWKYVYCYPKGNSPNLGLLAALAAIFLVGLAAAVYVSYLMSLRMFRPVMEITAEIEDFCSTDELDEPVQDEFKFISQNLMKTFSSIREMEQDLQGKLEQLKKSQTAALQSQINPHFLFNTLESINLKAAMYFKGENDISSMIQALSTLLRQGFETKDQLTTIQKELEHAKTYVRLLLIRYQDKLSVEWEIEEDILTYKICKITLQPIIENAVEHGIKPLGGVGKIWIRGKKKDNTIVLEITDSGQGMAPEKMEEVNRQLEDSVFREDTHIGLLNVNRRIKLIFGQEYGVSLNAAPQMGITVQILIPATKWKEENGE